MIDTLYQSYLTTHSLKILRRFMARIHISKDPPGQKVIAFGLEHLSPPKFKVLSSLVLPNFKNIFEAPCTKCAGMLPAPRCRESSMQGKMFIFCSSLANPRSKLRGMRSLSMFKFSLQGRAGDRMKNLSTSVYPLIVLCVFIYIQKKAFGFWSYKENFIITCQAIRAERYIRGLCKSECTNIFTTCSRTV